jgi:putative flippase GtrA
MGVLIRFVLRLLPRVARERLLRHREAAKFLIVGGTCFLVTVAINYALKLTVLATKPVTALTVATMAATVLSYAMNRRWAFRERGGRRRYQEAVLFFAINAAAVVVNDVPLWVARYLFDLQVPHVTRVVQELSDFASGVVVGTLLAMGFRFWAYRTWVFPHEQATPARTAEKRAA